jgi:hypothetical protein
MCHYNVDTGWTGEGRGVYRVLVGKPEGKNHWEDPGVDGSSGIGLWVYRLD